MEEAGRIVRRFVEDCHEQLEEQFVFPRLGKARKEIDLIATLRLQHQRGRQLTDEIDRLARNPQPSGPNLAKVLRSLARMYRPRAAREDTDLFPAFRSVVGRKEYRELGEQFEEQEHARFGEHGFEQTVSRIAVLETSLGIGDLARATPA